MISHEFSRRSVETKSRSADDVEDESEVEKPLIGLPEEESVFASSETSLATPSDSPVSVQAKALAILILLAASMGFLNGLDYAVQDKGLVRPHEFIYRFSEQAPQGSATLDGRITDAEGSPAIDYLVELVYLNGTIYQNLTNEDGMYHFEDVDPGLAELWIHTVDFEKGVQHRILLTPPVPGLEPIGFTRIDIKMPTDAEYAETCEGEDDADCIQWVDMTSEEMEMPLLDPQAGSLYYMLGFLFMGLATLASIFAVLGYRSGSRGLLRTAAVIVFFTQGHYYSSCFLGMVAVGLSFAIPSRD